MRKYNNETKLADNEFLCKIRPSGNSKQGIPDTGFLTKFNKDGSIPKAFVGWGETSYRNPDYVSSQAIPYIKPWLYKEAEVFIHTETAEPGWRLDSWRIGKSQEWATMIHPHGFTVEIYLDNFLHLCQSGNILQGEVDGSFKWEGKRLVK